MNSKKGLRNKVLESGTYLFIARALDKGSSIFTIIILARLLEPSEFGLMALAMIIITLVESLTAISLESALIQKSELKNSDLNVVWTYGRVVKSFFIISLVFFSAPYIAEFFNEPNLTLILQVMMLGHVFKAFENIGMIIYLKELDFQKDFYVTIISRLIRISVLLVSAYYLRNVWAFVLAYLSLNLTSSILSYFFHPYRPKFDFNTKIFRSLFVFGGWVFASQLIKALYDTIDRSAIGRIMTSTFLGYYHIAYRFGNEVPNELKSVFNQVMFPLFSIQKEDRSRSKSNFLMILKLTSFGIIPILTIVFFLSEYLIILLFGEQWISAITPLKLLLASALIQSLVSSSFPLFKGLGFPRYETYLLGISVGSMLVLIYPLTYNFGIEGAALTVLIAQLTALPFSIFFLKRIITIKFLEIILSVSKPLLVSIIIGCLISFIGYLNSHIISWAIFIQILSILMVFTLVFYLILLKINKDEELIFAHNLITSYSKKYSDK